MKNSPGQDSDYGLNYVGTSEWNWDMEAMAMLLVKKWEGGGKGRRGRLTGPGAGFETTTTRVHRNL